jgi:DNA repair exonuclease SbcCD nuclease subunit
MPYEEEVFLEPKTAFDAADCPSFSYDGEGKFTILHLTDIHLDSNPSLQEIKTEVLNFITDTIETEKPDLVIITGDLLYDSVSPVATLQAFVDLMDGLKQNWAFCYGNHDRERISTSVFRT